MAYNRKEEYLATIKKPKEITDALLETIDYIARARDAELSFDKTIIAEVISLNDASTGEYFVEYQKGKFRAYAPATLTYVYSKGTNVYVKVPGGDFTQKKTIEGKASATSYTEEEYSDLSQQVVEISEIYSNGNEYGILAYAPEPKKEEEETPKDDKDNSSNDTKEGTATDTQAEDSKEPIEEEEDKSKYYEQVIYENNNLTEDVIFTSLLTTYPRIMIQAYFRTQFYGTMMAGNYGLKIDFVEKDTGIVFSRRLDIINFSGSIYDYEVFSPQYVIYDLTGINLIGIKKITFFQERFLRYDTVFNGKGEITAVYDKEPNLFVKNIKLSFVDVQDSTKDLYYVGISAPQGLSLIQDTDKIKLIGVFYYANKNILEEKTCKCYWYKQNPAVLSGSEKYDQIGGPGWECINDSPNVRFNELTISGKDVYQQMRYKLVVVYNSNVTLYKDVRVVKYYNERFTIIPQFISENEVKLSIVDSLETINEADWYVDLMDGSYLPLSTGVSQIDVSQFLEYGNVIFYSISKLDSGDYVPCEYKLTTYKQESPVRVVFSGTDTFQYDDNGSISLDQANKEIIITPTISVDKENIGVKSVTWYSPDGGELLEYPTTKITNSMLSKLWIDKANNALHYYIKPKYVDIYTNNTLSLKVITLADKEFKFNKSIVFIKPGDSTISGLDYQLIIKDCNVDGSELDTKPINKKNGSDYEPIYLMPEVRYNGNKIINGSAYQDAVGNATDKYKITVEADPINLDCEKVNKEKNVFKISNPVEDCKGQYFIKFKVTIGLENKAITNQTLYYYKPIMVSTNFVVNSIGNINIPSKITYNEKGTPSLINKQISFMYKYDGKKFIDLLQVTNPVSLTDYIIIVNSTNSDNVKQQYLRPQENYPGAYFAKSTDQVKTVPMGALQIFLPDNKGSLFYPIVMLNNKDITIITDEDNDGTNIPVLDEDNVESEKPLDPGFSHGRPWARDEGKTYVGSLWENKRRKYTLPIEDPGKDLEIQTLSLEAEEEPAEELDSSGFVSGLYQYDIDGIPTNILRSDGVVKLAGDALCFNVDGSIQLKEESVTNILTVAKLLNEIATNADLKQQLSDYIAPKNIKLRDWYIEE